MMRRARRASLLFAFFLLTSAATARAECAWVLWMIAMGGGTTAAPLSAFTQRPDCEKDRVEKDRLIPEEKRTKDGAITFLSCLPDTVDPRGPKRGGR